MKQSVVLADLVRQAQNNLRDFKNVQSMKI